MKKLTEEIANALERTVDTLGLSELSRRTGLKISTLQRFMNRQSKYVRQETLDRLYPFLRPYILLKSADTVDEMPPRIGDEPRTGHWLEALVSDEKILLDVFSSLPELERREILTEWQKLVPDPAPTAIAELSAGENLLLGIFRKLDRETAEDRLLAIVRRATETMRRRREML